MTDAQKKEESHSYEVVQKVGETLVRQFWEISGELKVPEETPLLDQHLQTVLRERLPPIMAAPFLNRNTIKDAQLANVAKIVEIASHIPVYKERLEKAGIKQGRISSWEEFQRIPPIYKQDLLKVFPDGCTNPDKDRNTLFMSRSTGSTGVALHLYDDVEGAGTCILNNIRQFALQSGLNYGASDTVVYYYTTPWRTGAADNKYVTHFVSSLIPPENVADILAELYPNVLSLYPTNLETLLPFVDKWRHNNLKLVVTNSEQSTRSARQAWSKLVGVPVLDEYSTEEVSKIALEMPCGHYHTCDDVVITEILDPETLQPQEPGKPGVVVVTSLMNTSMPFIRYVQGDFATMHTGEHPGCAIQWGIIENIEGRMNDAFLKKNGKLVPSGTVLDITYRMMIDKGITLSQFELIQTDYDRFVLMTLADQDQDSVVVVREQLIKLLEVVMEYSVIVDSGIIERQERPTTLRKTRPIKRTFGPKL